MGVHLVECFDECLQPDNVGGQIVAQRQVLVDYR